ncbi:MAG: hypothetical protein R8G66_31680 [Cytophagales bacterium]|nr:hypothetical protein [Cytophagales bacterium]
MNQGRFETANPFSAITPQVFGLTRAKYGSPNYELIRLGFTAFPINFIKRAMPKIPQSVYRTTLFYQRPYLQSIRG